MYYMPVYPVPKPWSEKLQLVTNHNAGVYPLNSMISRDTIIRVVLDCIPALGQQLRCLHGRDQNHLVLWKSNVSHAYWLMPMSPYWQIEQVVTIDFMQHIDRCNIFGGHGSQSIWNAFMCLVVCIAVHLYAILLLSYVNNNFGAEEEGLLHYYEPYGYYYPYAQVQLLHLWDELGIPHKVKILDLMSI